MLHFDHPHMLWLAALALPLIALGWRAMAAVDRTRRAVALALRAAVIAALALMLAGPRLVREHDDLTVIGLLDISGSVQRFADLPPIAGNDIDQAQRRSNIEYLRRWFRQATQTRATDDRFGLIVFDGRAIAISAPTKGPYTDDNLDVQLAEGTDIAEALRLGLAMFPADTAKRLVLVSDGNETAGSALEAVRLVSGAQGQSPSATFDFEIDPDAAATKRAAPSRIPVDVLPVAYSVRGDVQVARIEAPPGALAGQTVTVRVVLLSTEPTTGTLTLRREDEQVDLNGTAAGTARRIDVPAGQSVHLAQVTLGQTPINRFAASFEPDDPSVDALVDNNRAEAFTATPSKGSALIVDAEPGASDGGNALAAILRAAEIPVTVAAPEQLPRDLLSMQNYDLVILDNVPASLVPHEQREMLARYVNDLGGGLIMVGGTNSFGAGGWNNTPVEDVLPVEMDPSKELRLPSAALVLVLDKSGSMNQPVAGARASQQRIANEGAALAIESLRSDSLVGVVTFDFTPSTLIPLQPNDEPRKLAAEVRAITADGGTNMPPAIERAYRMLKDAKAEKKRIVCMSDGRSNSNDYDAIIERLKAENIQLSCIAVGDDADEQTMREIAEEAGGEFYFVRDPRDLPRVLVDSVQVINKPLLKESPFAPMVISTGSTLTAGMSEAPILNGVVITSPRKDPKVALEMITPDNEPLLAHWQAGLGRAAAFTSASPRAASWASNWSDWSGASTFWTQLARTIARPATSTDAELLATIDGDRLNISYEVTGGATTPGQSEASARIDAPPDSRLLEYLHVAGSIYTPEGATIPIRLRQTAPGRYEASVDAPTAGNYIVALNPRQGSRALPPAIGGASKTTSPEFRRYRSNIGLLEEIAEATDGRRLDIADPMAVNLFDRRGMPRSESSLPIWPTILLWTLAVVLLDIACRRIAWDVPMLRSAALAGLTKVTPMRLRGRRQVETLSTLRRVSTQFDQQQAAQAEGLTKLKGTGRIKPPPERIIRSDGTSAIAFEAGSPAAPGAAPDAQQINAALDALIQPSADTAPIASPTPSSAADNRASPPADAQDTTSSLLAAKRRARQKMDGTG